MQAAQKHEISNGSSKFQGRPVQEAESSSYPPFKNLDPHSFSDDGSHKSHCLVQASDPYCTLESSSAIGGSCVCNFSSTLSFSPTGSPNSLPDFQSCPSDQHHSPENTYGSPVSGSCITDDVSDLRHKIRQLETVMLGSEADNFGADCNTVLDETSKNLLETEKWKQIMEMISNGELTEVLIASAKAIADNDLLTAEWLMSELRVKVSVSGEPIQRLGAYMLEGLVARVAHSGGSIYKALKCKEPASIELFSYMHLLYEVCPYFKFGYMSANGAIAEAMKGENRVHIIDFQIAQGGQWVTLIQALSARPGGPPHICVTGIDDSTSAYARGGGLDIVGKRLSAFALSCNVPFEFHAATHSGSEIKLESLGLQPGEALAVNFALMLHHMPDESVCTQNHRDRLLRLVNSLSPKVVTLVEQESNTNTSPFFTRFVETLDYYSAIFESIDVAMPRNHKDRINVEQHCLARDIVNIIACEGAERVERHELLGKWRSRFVMAGFTPYPLSPVVNATIRNLLENYCEMYRLEERDGALFLGWRDRPLVASCAFRPVLYK